MPPSVVFILPALNEEGSIGCVLEDLQMRLPALGLGDAAILVVDNGSTDRTASVARERGAMVISEPRRGYGQACLTGIASLPPSSEIVVFLDADGSDDLDDLAALLQPLLTGQADFVLGSRTLGARDPGAFAPQQTFGNWLATRLIWLLFGARYTDLGPFRAIRRTALESLGMCDINFGWTTEMQIRAHRKGLRTLEVPVRYRRRAAGKSKISGSLRGSVLAGTKILWTLLRFRLTRGEKA